MSLDKFKRFFSRKDVHRWIFIIAGIILLLRFLKPDLTFSVATFSLLGGFGSVISLSLIAFVFGVFLILVPEATTTIAGVVISGISLLVGGASIFAAINNLFGDSLGTIVLIVIGIFVLRGLITLFRGSPRRLIAKK